MSVIGVDLGGTNIRAGVVAKNRLVEVVSSPINSRGSEREVLDELCGVISSIMNKNVRGIGVGVPSVIDLKKGVLYDVQNIPSWKKVPLKSLLEKKYGVPVHINNDANCFALGEKHFGKARKYDHVVGLIIGTGLGAGVIANSRLYSGANCGAGEFGMLPYLDRHFEHYCSGQFFENVHGISGRKLYSMARKKDKKALQIFREYGRHLGEAVKAVLYAADPEIIVLGGSVSKASRYFRESMWESIGSFAYSVTLRNIRIEVSEIEHIAVLGAAALHFDLEA